MKHFKLENLGGQKEKKLHRPAKDFFFLSKDNLKIAEVQDNFKAFFKLFKIIESLFKFRNLDK